MKVLKVYSLRASDIFLELQRNHLIFLLNFTKADGNLRNINMLIYLGQKFTIKIIASSISFPCNKKKIVYLKIIGSLYVLTESKFAVPLLYYSVIEMRFWLWRNRLWYRLTIETHSKSVKMCFSIQMSIQTPNKKHP